MEASFLASTEANDSVFVINIPRVKFGIGSAKEIAHEASRLGMKSVLMVVGKKIAETKLYEETRSSLENGGLEVHVSTDVRVEPEDAELIRAYQAIKGMRLDGFIALGGGSTIDTAKILNLLYTYPRDIMDYVNRPIGRGLSPPGPLKPMIAVPTTAGTGSENTNVTIFDIHSMRVKTGISNQHMRPTVAVVDPLTTLSLPPMVTASSGLDVLNHAIESFTSHPYTAREKPHSPDERPVYSGATPISDIFARQAIMWVHRYLRRAVADPLDIEARYYMMLGASIAGIGFGHAGVHVPHAMAYPIAGMVREWHPEDYDFGYPISPHGISTAIPASYTFRYLAPSSHERFGEVAEILGIGHREMGSKELSDALFEYYVHLLEDLGIPTKLGDLGFRSSDVPGLVDGTLAQQRLLSLSPKRVGRRDLERLFGEMV
ncbi:hydroxyacid-oxoacid transhydrogenase [Thermogymnomonas acidicola]|nr:hydroxyacid-oxoacid transhydrogenase [Thermogymnomonas acidicola]